MWCRFWILFVVGCSLSLPCSVGVAQGLDGVGRADPLIGSNQQGSGEELAASSADASTVTADREITELFPRNTDSSETDQPSLSSLDLLKSGPEGWVSPDGLLGSVQTIAVLTILSMAPAILLMTTCYVRIVIVLGILKQAIGLPSLPPSQVMTSIALFMTLFVMTPVWQAVYRDAIEPYTNQDISMGLEDAYVAGLRPIRGFMSRQIAITGNHDDIHLFYDYMDPNAPAPTGFEDVPLRVLLPAFVLSELKTAFLMGFQIFLPFLVVDLVVASVTISMGMLMLPPQIVSLPFKLLLFVLVDGWRLVVQMLMDSFGNGF